MSECAASVNISKRVIPRLSIGMPVYNGEKFVSESLESLLAQTFTDFELIISDNASTDKTADICLAFASRDHRIRYIRQAENIGATANFEYVFKCAKGDFFMWSAVDDRLEQCFIEKILAAFALDEELVLIMSDIVNIDVSGDILYSSLLANIRISEVHNKWSQKRLLFFENPTTNIFFCIYGIFKTDVLKKIQLNYKNAVRYASGSEIPFLAQVALQGKIASISECLKYYRRHNDSIFHREARGFSALRLIENKLNISRLLFMIALESSLAFSEKVETIHRIFKTFIKFIFIFYIGQIVGLVKSFCRLQNGN